VVTGGDIAFFSAVSYVWRMAPYLLFATVGNCFLAVDSCLPAEGATAPFEGLVNALSAILIFCFVYYFGCISFVELVLELGLEPPA
jgi:hypothetical protein